MGRSIGSLPQTLTMFALIDCDNFFVSCERIFQPALKNRPVVVLSNNDGCVVARSYEAKALGIGMAVPFFKVERLFSANNGIALSSNYELYADISKRVMHLIREEFQNLEIYSIDEAFVRLPDNIDYETLCRSFRNKLLQYIGISVSIGIAPTKTLCKIAGEYAKKHDKIYFLNQMPQISELLKKIEVIDIWGVGRHTAPKLKFMGIFTGEDLRTAPPKMLRKAFGIGMEKTIMELNGLPCLEAESEEPQQSIISSRTFEYEIKDYNVLKQIIAEFVDSACQRLRKQESLAQSIIVSVSTNRFNHTHEQYYNSALINLESPTNNTAKFLQAMDKGLKQIFRNGIFYKRAGITLLHVSNLHTIQPDLLDKEENRGKEQNLMKAFDAINRKMGRKSIYFGAQAGGIKHYIRREFKSASYTTSWSGLAIAHA